ncbi:MAG: ribonuclease HII, partial [Alphaproteobacteria bacterium]
MPDFSFEVAHIKAGAVPVAGVDEAGRGPLAGPVVAGAVILRAGKIPPGIQDSKKLSAKKREALFALLNACADIGVGIVDVATIEHDNILNAALTAMRLAVASLAAAPAMVLVDGNRLPDLACPALAIVGGDARSLSIAAASIIAKVTRDAIMDDLARQFPAYGWQRNRGYGTAEHLAALKTHGPCP